MSGHSKWHSIRHKKAAVDAKRGKLFTKVIKEISVAARIGGGDLESNPRLRTAVQSAKSVNMPLDNINRAVKKGTGELPGQSYEATTYEGYGPGGVAVFIEVLTDNKNRSVAEIRHLLAKHGGNLGETGSVNWIFERKGYVAIAAGKVEEEALLEVALEAGAEDMQSGEEGSEIYTSFEDFYKVRDAIEQAGIDVDSAQLTMIPSNSVSLEGRVAERMLHLMDALEDHDDVQNVFANFEIDDAQLEALA